MEVGVSSSVADVQTESARRRNHSHLAIVNVPAKRDMAPQVIQPWWTSATGFGS